MASADGNTSIGMPLDGSFCPVASSAGLAVAIAETTAT